MIDDDDADADEQERAEAEALARALESEPNDASAPREALVTAALLRALGAKQELPGERARTVYDGLEPAIEHYVRPRGSSVSVLAWLGAGLAAAAALGLFLVREERPAAPRPPAGLQTVAVAPGEGLPAPSRKLLAAQAALGAEAVSDEARVAFEREMGAYRTAVLRALKHEYPVKVGVLDTEARR